MRLSDIQDRSRSTRSHQGCSVDFNGLTVSGVGDGLHYL
jgi:hypothetical protein